MWWCLAGNQWCACSWGSALSSVSIEICRMTSGSWTERCAEITVQKWYLSNTCSEQVCLLGNWKSATNPSTLHVYPSYRSSTLLSFQLSTLPHVTVFRHLFWSSSITENGSMGCIFWWCVSSHEEYHSNQPRSFEISVWNWEELKPY